MGEDDPRYDAPPPERPVQARHPPHHAEGVAVAEPVAEPVDEVDAHEKKVIKTGTFLFTALVSCVVDVEALCVDIVEAPNANANAPRLDVVDPPPNGAGPQVKWEVSRQHPL